MKLLTRAGKTRHKRATTRRRSSSMGSAGRRRRRTTTNPGLLFQQAYGCHFNRRTPLCGGSSFTSRRFKEFVTRRPGPGGYSKPRAARRSVLLLQRRRCLRGGPSWAALFSFREPNR
jgi:hypothetical protein